MLRPRVIVTSLLLHLTFALIAHAQVETNSSTGGVNLDARDSDVTVVSAGAVSNALAFTADPNGKGGDLFHIVSSQPDAKISLILPDNTEISEANAEARGFTYEHVPQGTFAGGTVPSILSSPGTHTLIELPPSASPGIYRIKIDASAVAGETVIVASYFSSSTVRAGVSTEPTYRVGDIVIISGLVLDGVSPVANATVIAAIGDSTDVEASPVQITLQDSGEFDAAAGDGIYTGTFTAARAGDFSVALRAKGASGSGASFSRFASTTFRVTQPLASFVSFGDRGEDANADGRIEKIVISADVDVQTSGAYSFTVTLKASNGERFNQSVGAQLPVGRSQLSVPFSWQFVRQFLKADAPYTIEDATLVYENEAGNELADKRSNVGRTGAYRLDQLDRPAVWIVGHRAYGVDTNGNGKFDLLRVEVDVDLLVAGIYRYEGSKPRDDRSEYESVDGGAGYLERGRRTLVLDFNGAAIGDGGIDRAHEIGFRLRRAELGGANIERAETKLRTSHFTFRQFEAARCRADVNNDGVVNQADIEYASAHLGKRYGDDGYDYRADAEWNLTVDEHDIEFINGQSGCRTREAATDTIAPTTSVARSVEPSAAGWNRSDVELTLTATDNPNGAGVSEISYQINDGAPVTVSGTATTVRVTNEGATRVSFQAKDAAGNVEATQTASVKIDRVAPQITFASPRADGGTILLLNQTVAAQYACADADSGIVSCIGAVANNVIANGAPLDASTLGEKQLMVQARDAAGNVNIRTVRYLVEEPCATDVTNQIRIEAGAPVYDKRTRRYKVTVKLTNTGADLRDTVSLAVDYLSDYTVDLANKSGVTNAACGVAGSPYINLNIGGDLIFKRNERITIVLQSNETSELRDVQISTRTKARIIAGTGRR